MREILPGVHHWTTHHDGIGIAVSSYYVEPAGLVIDPMVPEEGLGAFADDVKPQQVVLTTGLHTRHAARYREELGCTILVPREGAERIGDRLEVETYGSGDEIAPGVQAFQVGVLAPDDYVLHVDHGGGALSFADAVHHYGEGLAFFSDDLLGDDPRAVKDGLTERLRTLLEHDFDHLLFAHGEPIVGSGKTALRAFVKDGAA